MTKRTLEGTNGKSLRKSGFRARISTKSGCHILNNRRRKGRKKLTIS
jgi:large subunit ribosomal protein L34